MIAVPGARTGPGPVNDAFQTHLEHNAAVPFDNESQRPLHHHAKRRRQRAPRLAEPRLAAPPPRSAEIPRQDSKPYTQPTHLGPGITFGRREFYGGVGNRARPAGAAAACLSANVRGCTCCNLLSARHHRGRAAVTLGGCIWRKLPETSAWD